MSGAQRLTSLVEASPLLARPVYEAKSARWTSLWPKLKVIGWNDEL